MAPRVTPSTDNLRRKFNEIDGRLALLETTGVPAASVQEAVDNWLTANPPSPGQDGEDGADGASPTPEQIQSTVDAYIAAHPPADGNDGQNATPEQIAAAVTAYLTANPPAPGQDGANATDAQVAAAVVAYLADHPPQPGLNGTSPTVAIGTVTTGAPGSSASVVNVGTSSALVLDITIPRGAAGTNGTSPVFTVGTVTALAAGATPTVTITGTSASPVLNLGIPAGAAGAPGSPANTLAGTAQIGQNALVAIALGIREVTVALTGAVVGERYQAHCRRFKLNGAASWTAGRPAGYTVLDCVSNTAGNVTVSINAPLLAVGASYVLECDIVKVNT